MKAPVRRSVAVLLGLLLLGRLAPARSAPTAAATELTITSERGVLLSIDGKPIGRLPLPGPLLLPAGPHRFALERQNRRYETDLLVLTADRVAELSLTPGTKGTAISVLSLTPMILLALPKGMSDDSLQQAIRRIVTEAVRAEHAVLVPEAKADAATANQPPGCLTQLDCQLTVAQQLEARLVLVLGLPPPAPPREPGSGSGACTVHGEMFEVSTGQRAAQLELPCGSGEDQLLEATLGLTRRLVSAAANLGRGTLAVTSSPEGAQVLLDSRPRGVTPWQGPSLPGPRELVVTKDGFAPFPTRVNVTAAQLTTVPVELSALGLTPPGNAPPPVAPLPTVPVTKPSPLPDPPGRAPRPRWRLVSGGLALGAGVLLAGFGGSALAWNGHCADAEPPAAGPCATTFQTTGVGGGFLATGLVLAVGGAVLLALPGPRP